MQRSCSDVFVNVTTMYSFCRNAWFCLEIWRRPICLCCLTQSANRGAFSQHSVGARLFLSLHPHASKPMRMSKRALRAPAALDKAKSQIDNNISCGSLFTRSRASASNNGNPMIQRCSHGVVRSQPLSVKYRCLPKSKICNDVFSSRNHVQRGDWGEHTECVRERERVPPTQTDIERPRATAKTARGHARARLRGHACA